MTGFDELWERFLSDALSEEDAKELQRLLGQKNQQIPAAIDKLLRDKELKGLAPVDREKVLLSRILETRPETSIVPETRPAPATHPAPATRTIGRLWKWIAAAAILLLVIGTPYLFRTQQKTNTAQLPKTTNDLPPGHNGAILTLSNGQNIILDSAGNGVLASDANVKVIKKDGKISYEGKTAEVLYNDISTPKGRQWQLTLSDGTKVWLNAESSIHYPIRFSASGKNQRVVEVTGEAYFEVAHNPNAPFIVKTAQREIRVLGTHFNVNAYSNEPALKVTLLEGSIKVVSGPNNTLLQPGEQIISNSIAAQPIVKDVNTDDVIAWINGRFKFDNSDIRTVMRQIARWYNVEIEYRGTPPNYQFEGGTYRNINLSEVLKVLELSGVHFQLEENKIIVMP